MVPVFPKCQEMDDRKYFYFVSYMNINKLMLVFHLLWYHLIFDVFN